MKNKFKVSDESGDRKYFTIIPNYIVNHSTPYEQSIYLYMKRVAGESGTCWMSAKTIATKMGIARNTVAFYRDKLVKRGWLEIVGEKRTGQTNQSVIEYKIVDLWHLNNKHYNKAKSSSVEPFERVQDVNQRVQLVNEKSSTVGHKEEHMKKNPEEDINPVPQAGRIGKGYLETLKTRMATPSKVSSPKQLLAAEISERSNGRMKIPMLMRLQKTKGEQFIRQTWAEVLQDGAKDPVALFLYKIGKVKVITKTIKTIP